MITENSPQTTAGSQAKASTDDAIPEPTRTGVMAAGSVRGREARIHGERFIIKKRQTVRE
tara:strand:+ start:5449 stop:5628 length:180 start_codon:yes stop_codon:yes gene_type:complete